MSCIPCQNKANKIVHIVQGNLARVFKTDETETLADKRRLICEACPLKKKLIKVNQKQRYYCGVCKCPVESAIRAEDYKCPEGKW